MDFNPVILSIPLYFLLIGLELLHQLITKQKVYRTNDAITNISCGITSQITNALWGVLSIGMYQYVFQYWSFAIIEASWWSHVLLFVLVDFFYYWFHRASHEINFLWNTAHVVHHQSEDYNLSVALRQSSLGGLFSMVFYLPLALMGFSTVSFVAIKGINLIYQFWIHTETIKKMPRWFEWALNTPSHHRVHHGRNPKYIDKNHAGTLMIWDRMFDSFQAEEEKPIYGVTKPTNTWNPVWANLLPVVDMSRQVIATPGFINKMKVLFYKPGWRPAKLGGYQTVPDVETTSYKKFDQKPSLKLFPYIFTQFVLVLGFTSVFLFTQTKYEIEIKLILAFYIIWSIVQLGILMENRRFAVLLEFFRIIASGVLIFFSLNQPYALATASVFALVFGLWLYLISRKEG